MIYCYTDKNNELKICRAFLVDNLLSGCREARERGVVI